ncbi:MAG: type II CAAX endopeptidase family protein [Candidatus Poribacteria bacterium]|nr:type II CAAX endopeptidase family protein [Candidatus Poribacteria bacterium]MDE0503125.1 type II CAAX endopeptidase family protein [Candidatus Poribacteria bacterium]
MGEHDAKVYYPDIRQAIWILVQVVLWMILLSIPLAVVDFFVDYPLYQHPAVLAVINFAAIGIVLDRGIRKSGGTLKEICPTSSVAASLYPVMALLCLGAGILLSESDNILRTILPAPEWIMESLSELVGGKQSLWGSVLVLIIVAPLTEEFLFRGLILDGFLRKYSIRKSVLVSATLFAVFHLNPWQFPAAFVLGTIFAWWRVNTGSILPGILGHAFFNGIPMIVLGMKIEITGFSSDPTGPIKLQPWWFDVVGVILFVTAFFTLQQRFAEREP